MPKYTVPNGREEKLCRENGIDPNEVAVSRSSENALYLLNYKTRDTIVIHKGDRKWS